MEWFFWVAVIVSACLATVLLEVTRVIWWKPLQLKKYFETQGIQGPPYKLFYGNVPDVVRMARQESSRPLPHLDHNIVPKIFPAYQRWSESYGQDFVYWIGTKPVLYVSHPELVREILSNKSGDFQKLQFKQRRKPGLAALEGEKWAQRRKILNPAFHIELLKGMIPSIVESSTKMLGEWSKLVSSGANEIEVFRDFCTLAQDVISHTAFGSSYAEGKHIFQLQAQQNLLAFEHYRSVYIPGSRFLPTRKNRQQWWLQKEIKRCLKQVIQARKRTVSIEKSGDYGMDLLGLMMTSNENQGGGKMQNTMYMTTDDIISECQLFYTAGSETTSSFLTWTMVLLGMHQDWQDQARREVLEICEKNHFPNADTINGLKILGMILNKSLRLYPPIVLQYRQTSKAVKLGRLSIPAGTQLQIPILAIHHDQGLWGDDVHQFNPERFNQGISKASKHSTAFMPFGLGPRICIGQNFGLLEAKVVLAMILQRFSFVISPCYICAPLHSIGLKPQHGAQIIFYMN